MKQPVLFTLIGGIFLASLSLSRAETHLIKWDAGDLTMPSDDSLRFVLDVGPQGGMRVDASSEPPNPFTGPEFALHVKRGETEGWYRLHMRSLVNEALLEGALLADVVLVENGVQLQVGTNEIPWEHKLVESVRVEHFYFVISLRPDQNLTIQGYALRTDSTDLLEVGVPYSIVVKWDFNLPEPAFLFYLNGEKLINTAGEVFILPAREPNMQVGANVARISLGNAESQEGEMFLGRIMLFEKPGEFWSPELPEHP